MRIGQLAVVAILALGFRDAFGTHFGSVPEFFAKGTHLTVFSYMTVLVTIVTL